MFSNFMNRITRVLPNNGGSSSICELHARGHFNNTFTTVTYCEEKQLNSLRLGMHRMPSAACKVYFATTVSYACKMFVKSTKDHVQHFQNNFIVCNAAIGWLTVD
jgi:hypothetical protein